MANSEKSPRVTHTPFERVSINSDKIVNLIDMISNRLAKWSEGENQDRKVVEKMTSSVELLSEAKASMEGVRDALLKLAELKYVPPKPKQATNEPYTPMKGDVVSLDHEKYPEYLEYTTKTKLQKLEVVKVVELQAGERTRTQVMVTDGKASFLVAKSRLTPVYVDDDADVD